MNEVTIAKPPEPPAELRADGPGRRLWDSVVGVYRLRPDELRILEDACWTAEEIEYWRTEAEECRRAGHGERVVRGSTGQRKLNPVLVRADKAAVEARQNRVALAGMLTKLGLPDIDDPAAVPADSDNGQVAQSA